MSPYPSSCSLGFVEVKVIFRIWRELSSGKWVFLPRRRDEQVTAKESRTVLRGYSSSSCSVLSLVWVFQRKAYLSLFLVGKVHWQDLGTLLSLKGAWRADYQKEKRWWSILGCGEMGLWKLEWGDASPQRATGISDRKGRIFPAGKKRTPQPLTWPGENGLAVSFPNFVRHFPTVYVYQALNILSAHIFYPCTRLPNTLGALPWLPQKFLFIFQVAPPERSSLTSGENFYLHPSEVAAFLICWYLIHY